MQHPPEKVTVPNLETLRAECKRLRTALTSPNTQQSYAADWRVFRTWCKLAHRRSLPASPETLALFLVDLIARGRKVNTAERRAHGVAYLHRQKQLPNPLTDDVKTVLWGARRAKIETPRQMAPLCTAEVRKIVQRLRNEGTQLAMRDRAIVLTGYASALRRANLRALNLSDIEFVRQGYIIHVRREKQDQQGKGRYIGIPFGTHEVTCPVRALREWLKTRGNHQGALFSTSKGGQLVKDRLGIHTIHTIVKRSMEKAGIDSRGRGPNSLRSGFITTAGEAGASDLLIAKQSGHRSMAALRRYFRPSDLFRVNACTLLGL